jgi:hypothetical protein
MKKTTLLLGAGAMIPFGGPSTSTITERLLIHNSCEDVYKVIQNGFEEKCNFESLLSALELLLEWNLSNDTTSHSTYRNTSIFRNVFQLGLPFKYHTTDMVWEIYKQVVNDIIEVIRDYDYYPQYTGCRHGKDPAILDLFISKYQEKSNLKIYTLNYDRLIPNLIGNHLEVYEGIEGESFVYNLKKFSNHHFTYFNLHGSIYIDYNPYTGIKLLNRPVELENAIKLAGGNPNEQKIFLPIIAGYHKSQRMMSQPFNFGLGAFMCDCDDCETIIIVGYSFSDPHINSILSNFIKTNITKIIIVDYSSDHIPSRRMINTVKRVFKTKTDYERVEDGVYRNTNDAIILFLKGFDYYIENYLNYTIR